MLSAALLSKGRSCLVTSGGDRRLILRLGEWTLGMAASDFLVCNSGTPGWPAAGHSATLLCRCAAFVASIDNSFLRMSSMMRCKPSKSSCRPAAVVFVMLSPTGVAGENAAVRKLRISAAIARNSTVVSSEAVRTASRTITATDSNTRASRVWCNPSGTVGVVATKSDCSRAVVANLRRLLVAVMRWCSLLSAAKWACAFSPAVSRLRQSDSLP